jgi:hypothetical protein
MNMTYETYEHGTFSWGYGPAVTKEHKAYWGARTIWTGGDWDILHDRQSLVATDKDAAERLARLLNSGRLKAAGKRLKDMSNKWEVTTSEPGEVVLLDDGLVRIVGNSNGSYGYFYVTAQLLEAT